MATQPASTIRSSHLTGRRPGKWLSLALLAASQILAISVWFSGSAVVLDLQAARHLDANHAALFTSAVQAGFVVGTLVSALYGLADRIDPRRLLTLSAVAAGTANAMILLTDPPSEAALVLRFVTGACLAACRT
jgi:nitrate/nitrite transporter NarK